MPKQDLMSTMDVDRSIERACKRLGFSSLRPQQNSAVLSFLRWNDVFVSLPTGSGKSLCFAILPFAFDELHGRTGSVVIVVSPLISLMKDQVGILHGPSKLCFIMEQRTTFINARFLA